MARIFTGAVILELIEIDGSFGEGGGQILRTALSLSCLLNKPFRIFNIRKGRKKPGLMPQHIVSVKAAAQLSGAEVIGVKQGSMELLFRPNIIKGGDFSFDIGTAGSACLVLQTILPSMVFSNTRASVMIKGGTHVPFSPSFNYISEVFVPTLRGIGITLKMDIESYGFYPIGGGLIRAEVSPCGKINPIRIIERGRIREIRGYSCVANLPLSIAERQREAFIKGIGPLGIPLNIELMNVASPGQGTFLFVKVLSENAIAGFASLGAKGKRAETVGEEAAKEVLRYLETDAALDPHLPDQIVLYLSLCKEESVITTSSITEHLLTNLWVIGRFTDFRYAIEGDKGRPGLIRINP